MIHGKLFFGSESFVRCVSLTDEAFVMVAEAGINVVTHDFMTPKLKEGFAKGKRYFLKIELYEAEESGQ